MGYTVEPLKDEQELMAQMTTPSEKVRDAVASMDGEVMILGVGGKMGPTIAELLMKSGAKEVIGVSRFPKPGPQEYLDRVGVTTVKCDLLERDGLAKLPDVPNIILAAGFKFGATGKESLPWAMNTLLPGEVMQRFRNSRVVYISSGNVYRFTTIASGGASETDPVDPIGEYAQSRLGGERAVEFYADRHSTPSTIVRLFYSTELRYGIICDVVGKVFKRQPLNVTMGHVNQIWQGDAASYIAQCFPLCDSPAKTINLTGPEVLSVRDTARRAGELMGIEPVIEGQESATALLGNSTQIMDMMGQPAVSIDTIIQWASWWIEHGGTSLGKPTKFEVRDGRF
ncbi:MAG: epimerase [Armatimonadetes bacterium CG_4_9_14_3_um_filter_58_7]|nr:MAG: epimerase [Armatimonadetes bacterium CG_4_9_14_3_um_filter_58_7]